MGNIHEILCSGASIANIGNAVPAIEKLNTPQRELTDIAIRIDGINPKINTPKPWADITPMVVSSIILQNPPGCGKCSQPNR
jgi:ABC-type phosphate transport system substrate-binding protein